MNHRMISAWNTAWQRLLVLAVGGLVSLGVQGQAVVDPSSQPFDTLAPYVLERSNLEPTIGNPDGGTLAYRPWFENGSWTGDLIQYSIDKDGRRSFTGGTIGLYPRDGAEWNTMDELWSARYVFPDYEPYDLSLEFDPSWECVATDDADAALSYWGNRNIFTLNESGQQVSFLWPQLDANQQNTIDPATVTLQSQPDGNTLEDEPFASDVVNYLRGDRSLELCKEGGRFRWRFSLLGAIVNSRPVYVPAGTSGLVVVGANDGMLHGFQAGPRSSGGGDELWGYIPSMLLDDVGLLRAPAYRARYFVDGELRTANISTISSPRHIVAGGLGAGGKGLFVLDVTTPANPNVVFEISGEDADHVGGIYNEDIGHIYGRPTIAEIGDKWFAVFGNGYGSDNRQAKLILVPLDANGGEPIPIPTDGSTNNGLSAPALVDTTGDDQADVAYAGDLHGNLWKFDLVTRSGAVRLFRTGDNETDRSRPITMEPDVTRHPDNAGGYMVYFGTGSLLSGVDAQDSTRQWVFGVWDRGDGEFVDSRRLVPQRLISEEVTWNVPADTSACPAPPADTQSRSWVRFIETDPDDPQYPDWTKETPDLGWKLQFPRDGERLIGRPQVRAERLQFITTNPYDMADPDLAIQPDSGSWVLQLDLASGGNSAPKARPLYDLNENCLLDSLDGLPPLPEDQLIAGVPEGTYPVGVHVGPFNVAQPAFARVAFNPTLGSVVDGVYINALQLPEVQPPPEDVLHGPIDVTTDSPNGTAHHTPVYAAPLNDADSCAATLPAPPEALKGPFDLDTQAGRDFPEASGPTKPFLRDDGIGHRVQGHSFAYNKHHGVDYVDIFTLEPRRGAFDAVQNINLSPEELPNNHCRLDIGATYFDESDNLFKMIPPQTLTAQELNRVTEVGIDTTQEFIVVLANADRSTENVIQIGCEILPVYDYQENIRKYFQGYLENESQAALDSAVSALADDSLVFTLDQITGGSTCTGTGPYAKFLSPRPTIRITPIERVGVYNATVGSLPGCVNNTDYYVAPTNDVQLTRKDELASDGDLIDGTQPADLYKTAPHTTAAFEPKGNNNPEWTGYRWRNGALTVQLLAVNDRKAAFQLQDSADLPVGEGVPGIDLGFGGIYAKAFTVDDNGTIVPLNVGVPSNADPAGPGTSGLLYEMSMFWNWGDSARFQTQGAGNPVIPVCLGTSDYQPSIMFESEWLTSKIYGPITDAFRGTGKEENIELQRKYLQLVADSKAGDQTALLNLYQMFVDFPSIAQYHRMRHYVPNSKQLNDNNLIAIDRGEIDFDLTPDGTPAPVVDIEADLLPSLGPNYQPGRRSWIDISPE